MEDPITPTENSVESTVSKTIVTRQEKQKKRLLEELKKVPIVEIACKKSGIGRASYYRWRQSDIAFREESDVAIKEGIQLINELAESKLISQIQGENLGAIIFWLKSRNPAYKDKIEVSAKRAEDEDLTKDQESIVNIAMGMAETYLNNPTQYDTAKESNDNDTANNCGKNQQRSTDQSKTC